MKAVILPPDLYVVVSQNSSAKPREHPRSFKLFQLSHVFKKETKVSRVEATGLQERKA